MALRSGVLSLIIALMSCAVVDGHVPSFTEHRLKQRDEQHMPQIHCTIATSHIKWVRGSKDDAVSVMLAFQGTGGFVALPSLHLIALPERHDIHGAEYWAPFSVVGGTTNEKQVLQPADGTTSQVIHVTPSTLSWAPAKSSVWPSESFAKAVPPARYILQVQVELSEGRTISSNKIEITIVK